MIYEFGEGEDIVLEADWAEFELVPLDGVARQKAEEYLEKLKRLRPDEYEDIMKQRADRERKG